MDAHPTYDDVELILRLYELRREEKMRKAREWFGHFFRAKSLEDFQRICPAGSDENTYYRMVTSYWEMVASFITVGVLHEKLFFQSGRELLFVWEKIRDVLPVYRELMQDAHILGNLETVAKSYISWMESQSAGSYAAFSSRVREG